MRTCHLQNLSKIPNSRGYDFNILIMKGAKRPLVKNQGRPLILIFTRVFVKMAEIFSPKMPIAPTIAKAIRDSSKAYSTELAPDSSLKSFLILSMSPSHLLAIRLKVLIQSFCRICDISSPNTYCTHNRHSDQRYQHGIFQLAVPKIIIKKFLGPVHVLLSPSCNLVFLLVCPN
jgi:hypothetical protein